MALKRAKHTRHAEARKEPKNQNQTRAHESKQPHKPDGKVPEPKPEKPFFVPFLFPATPLGTVTATISMLLVLGAYAKLRRKKASA